MEQVGRNAPLLQQLQAGRQHKAQRNHPGELRSEFVPHELPHAVLVCAVVQGRLHSGLQEAIQQEARLEEGRAQRAQGAVEVELLLWLQSKLWRAS